MNNKIEKQNPTKIQQNWSHIKINPTTTFIQLLRIEKKYNEKKEEKK